MSDAIKMPDLGSGTEEGTLLNWLKKVGDKINAGDVIAEVESDKATVEIPASASGTIIQLIGQPGETLKVGAVIGYVGAAGETPSAEDASAAPLPAAAEPTQTPAQTAVAQATPAAPVAEVDGNLPDGVKASPVARRLAAEKKIDLKLIKGSGPNGRIVREDVENFKPSAAPAAPAQAAPAMTPMVTPAPTYGALPTGEDVEILDISRLRTTIARRMVDSKQQVPHFYVTTQVDVSALLDLRKQLNAPLDDEHKISVNDLVIKAAALTLRKFPNLNSHFYGDKIVRYKRINIGIAVALPDGGLMNVVAKDADKISLGAMAVQNKEMIARARERKVKPDDVQGSTFTVSNLGAYDVDVFSAIINPPEAGILAVGSAQKIPVVKDDGSIGIANRMKVTISVDHRVSDGAEAAQYLQAFKKLVESPMQLLI
ncbi:MAG: dihydrolipoamide acetyltransferase family protein [Anaerolineae bacterium]